MGKSASGKDTAYERLLSDPDLKLSRFIMYTTRPIRAKEEDGIQYYFVKEDTLRELSKQGRVIEVRSYDTVQGIWYYFTADSDRVDLDRENYLALGTLESFQKIRDFYGRDRVVPLYIEVDNGIRLERALKRERKQNKPDYEEMCRRFLADEQDFSEENIKKAGIIRRFSNNEDREICFQELTEYIRDLL